MDWLPLWRIVRKSMDIDLVKYGPFIRSQSEGNHESV